MLKLIHHLLYENNYVVMVLSAIFVAIIGFTTFMSSADVWAKAPEQPTIVLFKASWSAASRDVAPMVQDLSTQLSLPVTVIDVDDATAAKSAKDLGLEIPKGEIPQVLLVKRGQTSLLFDGNEYRYGKRDVVKTTLIHNIQQALGKPGS